MDLTFNLDIPVTGNTNHVEAPAVNGAHVVVTGVQAILNGVTAFDVELAELNGNTIYSGSAPFNVQFSGIPLADGAGLLVKALNYDGSGTGHIRITGMYRTNA